MNYKQTTALFIAAALMTVAGCARGRFPDVEIKPIKQFSLGSAKFTPFKTRPTAEELYKTTLRLYDSFETVAITAESKGQNVSEWSKVDGKAEDVKMNTYQRTSEYRAIIPNKILVTSNRKDAWVMVRNGSNNIDYFRDRHQYVMCKDEEDFPNPAALWTHMLPSSGDVARPFSSIKLLPDQKIKGTEVYVLELKVKAMRSSTGVSPGGTTAVFLGKNDLLPRRIVDIQDKPISWAKVKGLPANTSTSEFLGFVVNSKLSEALFPTKPPKGAKPMKSEVVE